MACLKNRGGIWFARIRWTDEYKVRQEKQVTLRTKSKVTARYRLSFVNKEEKDIINGMSFSFPWMNDEGQTKLVRFTLNDAINEWISRRKKLNIRTKTLETNENGLTHFEKYIGGNGVRPPYPRRHHSLRRCPRHRFEGFGPVAVMRDV